MGAAKKITSFLSIKDTLDSAVREQDENIGLDSSEKEKEDFKEEAVKIFWYQYLENIREKQAVVYNALNATVCKVKENYVIFFEFPSNSAYDEFENLREDFFQKLKKHLNNYSIGFEYEIKETQRTILLSSKDKYERMLKVNPLLEKLRNDFRLDI